MRKFLLNIALFSLINLILFKGANAREVKAPWFSATYNAMETIAFIAANKLFIKDRNLLYIPLHFDINVALNDRLGLNFGLVYRYETYQDKGPLYSDRGNVRPKQVWTNYHDLFLLAGPRFSPLKTGLEGFFVSLKGGVGFATSPRYFSTSALLGTDVGYSFCFKNPGFNLTLGGGVLLTLPFYETLPFSVLWDRKYQRHGAIGVLVHHVTPIINVGLGFNL